MSKDIKRGFGDNQNPIEKEAVRLVKKIYEALKQQSLYCDLAVRGKNKTIRDINAIMSIKQNADALKSLRDWHEIIEAKENGEDVHSGALKSKKLNIVSGAEQNFAQYIIDKEINDKR